MTFPSELLLFIVIGFVAQMIDGTLGMGFGVISSALILVAGFPPMFASSGVHLSKIFTNGASGLSHWRFGNVDRKLLLRLLPGGVIGGILGATVLSNLPPHIARPLVAVYLMIAGLVILSRAFRRNQTDPSQPATRSVFALGALGGFLDAIGGGGWGPVVTSTLVARGGVPRIAIGSGSFAEFFVALTISAALFGRVNLAEQGQIVAGLIIGGVVAAPLAAFLAGRIPPRAMMFSVGLLVIVLSIGIL